MSFFRYQAALDAEFRLCSLSLLLSIYFPCKLFSWSWYPHGKAEIQPGRCKETFWGRIDTTNTRHKQLPLLNEEGWKTGREADVEKAFECLKWNFNMKKYLKQDFNMRKQNLLAGRGSRYKDSAQGGAVKLVRMVKNVFKKSFKHINRGKHSKYL